MNERINKKLMEFGCDGVFLESETTIKPEWVAGLKPDFKYWDGVISSKNREMIDYNLKSFFNKENYDNLKEDEKYKILKKIISIGTLEQIKFIEEQISREKPAEMVNRFKANELGQLIQYSRSNGNNPHEQNPFFMALFNRDHRVFFYCAEKFGWEFDKGVFDCIDYGDKFYSFLLNNSGFGIDPDIDDDYHKMFNNKTDNSLFLAKYSYILDEKETIKFFRYNTGKEQNKSSMCYFENSPAFTGRGLEENQFAILVKSLNFDNYPNHPLLVMAKDKNGLDKTERKNVDTLVAREWNNEGLIKKIEKSGGKGREYILSAINKLKIENQVKLVNNNKNNKI